MTKYSKEQMIAAIEEIKAGKSIKQVAKQNQISVSLTGLDLTRYSRPVFTRDDRTMFTTHSRPVFTT